MAVSSRMTSSSLFAFSNVWAFSILTAALHYSAGPSKTKALFCIAALVRLSFSALSKSAGPMLSDVSPKLLSFLAESALSRPPFKNYMWSPFKICTTRYILLFVYSTELYLSMHISCLRRQSYCSFSTLHLDLAARIFKALSARASAAATTMVAAVQKRHIKICFNQVLQVIVVTRMGSVKTFQKCFNLFYRMNWKGWVPKW